MEDGDNLSQSILSTGAGMSRFDHDWWLPVSHFMVEGDSFLQSVRTVGVMLPLSEVKRPLETRWLSVL